jgi:hypothetical protein
MLDFRAHHLLCIQGFQGYGYNEEFTKNMMEVLKNIDSNPESKLISECDVICAYCPHNINGICCETIDSAQKIKKMDLIVLNKLKLKVGTKGRIKEFISLANSTLKNLSDIQDVCGNCNWQKKCLWFLSRDI